MRYFLALEGCATTRVRWYRICHLGSVMLQKACCGILSLNGCISDLGLACATSRMRVYHSTMLGLGLLLRLGPVRRRRRKVANLSYDLRRPARVRYINSRTNLVSSKQVEGMSMMMIWIPTRIQAFSGINIKGGRNRLLYSGPKPTDHIWMTKMRKRVMRRMPQSR